MKKKLVLGIIGCGYIADYYIKNLQTNKDVEIDCCFDINKERLLKFSNYHGISPVNSFEIMLKRKNINIILNLTPPEKHFEINKKCLLNDKNVYCEKPLCLDFDETKYLVNLCKERDLNIWSAPSIIFNEYSNLIRKKIIPKLSNSNTVGYAYFESPSLAKLNTNKWINPSGAKWPLKNELLHGPIIEHAGYLISLLCSIFGPVKKVSSMPIKILTKSEKELSKLSSKKIALNHCISNLFFENNIVMTLIISEKTKSRRSLEIFDENISFLISDIRDDFSPIILNDFRASNFITSRANRIHQIVRRITNYLPTLFSIPLLYSNPFNYNQRLKTKKNNLSYLFKNEKPANFINGILTLRNYMKNYKKEYFMEEFFLHCNEVNLKIKKISQEVNIESTFNKSKLNEFLSFNDEIIY